MLVLDLLSIIIQVQVYPEHVGGLHHLLQHLLGGGDGAGGEEGEEGGEGGGGAGEGDTMDGGGGEERGEGGGGEGEEPAAGVDPVALGGDEVEVLVPPGPGGEGGGEEKVVVGRGVGEVEGHVGY